MTERDPLLVPPEESRSNNSQSTAGTAVSTVVKALALAAVCAAVCAIAFAGVSSSSLVGYLRLGTSKNMGECDLTDAQCDSDYADAGLAVAELGSDGPIAFCAATEAATAVAAAAEAGGGDPRDHRRGLEVPHDGAGSGARHVGRRTRRGGAAASIKTRVEIAHDFSA
jgi:hypothetical protein